MLWAAEVIVGGAITAMAVNDLVSRWEQMRNDIERQLEILRSGHIETHDEAKNTTAETIERLRELRGKLELLLLTKPRDESEGEVPKGSRCEFDRNRVRHRNSSIKHSAPNCRNELGDTSCATWP